ncbi:reverse transcriptase domain-containing protein [Tanacetum coccineum]
MLLHSPMPLKLLLLKNTTPPPASVKAVEESCVTYGGPHPYYQLSLPHGNDSWLSKFNISTICLCSPQLNYNQGIAGHRPRVLLIKVRTTQFSPVQNNQNREFQATMLQQNNKLENMLSNYFQMNKPLSAGPLPSNTVTNPKDALLYMSKLALTFKNLLSNKEKLFELANTSVNENCSTIILKKLTEKLGDPGKFLIPCNFPEIVECLALADLGASIKLMPLSIWRKLSLPELTPTQMILELANRSTTRPTGITKDVFFPTLIDVYGEELTLRVSDEAITFKVGNTSRYSYNDVESINRIDVIDIACEEYSQEVLGFFDNSESGNPTLIFEPIIAKSSPSLTSFEGGDLILEEIEAHLASDSVLPGIDDAKFDPEGDIHLIEEMLNKDPYSPLPLKDLKCEELKSVKSSVDEPSELELKDLPSHLEYTFLEGTNKLPVIIAKNLKDKEKERLIKVLKSHKQAIAWKLSNIKGIDPQFRTHKILMEDDFKPAVQHQRRVLDIRKRLGHPVYFTVYYSS